MSTSPDAVTRAEAIVGGVATDVDDVGRLAAELTTLERYDVAAALLIHAARLALYRGWEPGRQRDVAKTLKAHQYFGYARRVLARLSEKAPEDHKLRQEYALCVYKDMELPAARRLDRALEILRAGGELEESTSAETLGLAGAVYKRKWELDGKRADLEAARSCYLRGWEKTPSDDPEREYAGVNAAFVLDQLARLEEQDPVGDEPQAAQLWKQARTIREEIAEALRKRVRDGPERKWDPATLGEALFGLGDFADAKVELAKVRLSKPDPWELQTTAIQLAAIARLHDFGATPGAGEKRAALFHASGAADALRALLGEDEDALQRSYLGKVGLALSGGGFRASLFHIGVLARLAERDVLRHVEVLSCVSGGSILGAFYYLKLRRLLQQTPDREIGAQDYVDLVRELADEFLEAVGENLRGRLFTSPAADLKMLTRSGYSRTSRTAELIEKLILARIDNDDAGPDRDPAWRMTDLRVGPVGRELGFSPRYENWRRGAKVPILVLNATTLNSGHNWQFTASWMGEPPAGGDERVDANQRLRRLYYGDAPPPHGELPLATAVAASACVPGLFPPIEIDGLYDDWTVGLVDGGVHDNQGIASVLEQDCSVVLVSDASGQMGDRDRPSGLAFKTATRSNSILMSRVRGAQYADLSGRLRSGTLRRLMIVHMKKGLPMRPRDWHDCQEPWDPVQDELPVGQEQRRVAYRIHERVQRLLADLRTDLDAFSDGEAYSLMAAGYRMTEYELAEGLPDFPAPSPAPAPVSPWPFQDAFDRIARDPSETGLEVELAVGHQRFFRGVRAWWMRRNRPG